MRYQIKYVLPSETDRILIDTLSKLKLNPPSDMSDTIDNLMSKAASMDDVLRIILAVKRDEVIGWSTAEIWTSSTGRTKKPLVNVFVHPEYRGRGIGTKLAKLACEKLKELTSQLPYRPRSNAPDFFEFAVPEYFPTEKEGTNGGF